MQPQRRFPGALGLSLIRLRVTAETCRRLVGAVKDAEEEVSDEAEPAISALGSSGYFRHRFEFRVAGLALS
jgi:hypothetical protein